jgi:5-methylthioadenosine/S-adenosylhomocysteine deaminase
VLRGNAARLGAEGVTAVGEIDSTGVGPGALAATGLAGRCYQEVTGFHLDAVAARQLVRARRRRGSPAMAAGLSPHAPYSVSPALFRAAQAGARALCIHCAETPAEQQFLHTGGGPFAELLRRLGRLPGDFRAPGVGAVRWLERLGLLRASTLLVHCQELEPGDLDRVRGAGCPIAVCPGTIEWFGRTPPPVPRWLAAGVPVALGTDSRASNADGSLRGALAAAARLWPELAPERLLAMATAGGGRALARPGLGRLTVGGRADLFAIRARGDRAVPHIDELVSGRAAIALVVAGGRRRYVPGALVR